MGFNLFKTIEAISNIGKQEYEKDNYLDMRDYALSCNKCNHLAYPIKGTPNRYKCDHCKRQFAGSRHPF